LIDFRAASPLWKRTNFVSRQSYLIQLRSKRVTSKLNKKLTFITGGGRASDARSRWRLPAKARQSLWRRARANKLRKWQRKWLMNLA